MKVSVPIIVSQGGLESSRSLSGDRRLTVKFGGRTTDERESTPNARRSLAARYCYHISSSSAVSITMSILEYACLLKRWAGQGCQKS